GGNELHLFGITQHGSRHGAAEVHVQTAPVARTVGLCKTGAAGVHAAGHDVVLLDVVEHLASHGGHGSGKRRCDHAATEDCLGEFHDEEVLWREGERKKGSNQAEVRLTVCATA